MSRHSAVVVCVALRVAVYVAVCVAAHGTVCCKVSGVRCPHDSMPLASRGSSVAVYCS